jgi:hypothetical protein
LLFIAPEELMPLQVPHSNIIVVQSKEMNDPGSKSEGEDESIASTTTTHKKPSLGRTPNHLSLSTTSTLSAGSTGSQARLIQSSHQPENYMPQPVKELGKVLLTVHSPGRRQIYSDSSIPASTPSPSSTTPPTCMQCYLSGHYENSF